MGEAAHGGALGGDAAGVVGVDLHQVAEAVGLVAPVLRGVGALGRVVEAGELAQLLAGVTGGRLPQVAALGGLDAHALLVPRLRAGVDKAGGPVLLGRDVGAPGREAVAAVVVGAAHLRAVGRERRAHRGRATHGPGQRHRRGGGEAAVVARVLHDGPAARLQSDVQDGHAVGVDLLAHFFGGALAVHLRGAGRVQRAFVDVFVVDGQQPFGGRALQRKVMHAVVVHAGGVQQVVGGVGAVAAPGLGDVVERGAPCAEHLRDIAGRHHAGVGHGGGQRLEAQRQLGRLRRAAAGAATARAGLGGGRVAIAATAGAQGSAGHGGEGRAQAATGQRAAREGLFQDGAEGLVGAGVANGGIGRGFAHGAF